MAIHRVRLSFAIDRFLEHAQVMIKQAASTVDSKRRTLEALALQLGNGDKALGLEVHAADLAEHHFTGCLQWLATPAGEAENEQRRQAGKRPRTGRAPQTLVTDEVTLKQFLAFCKYHHWVPKRIQLLTDVLQMHAKGGEKGNGADVDGGYIPLEHWRTALDIAGQHHPKTRVVFALGLLWGRRVSEMVELTFADAEHGSFTNVKLRRETVRAMPEDLKEELRLWTAWLIRQNGVPEPTWYMVPARRPVKDIWSPRARMVVGRDPTLWPVDPERASLTESVRADVKLVLKQLAARGMFVCTKADLAGEATHALRRSHARALEELFGADVASTSLDHKDLATLRKYSGDTAKVRRHAEAMAAFRLPEEDTHQGDNVVFIHRRAPRVS